MSNDIEINVYIRYMCYTDKTPFAVLLGMGTGGVEMFIEGHERTDSKISSPKEVKRIDYLYSTGDIIFLVNYTYIYRYSFTKKILVEDNKLLK